MAKTNKVPAYQQVSRPIIKIQDVEYRTVFMFSIPRVGWEMDNTGYVVVVGNSHRVVLTSHGHAYFAADTELAEHIALLEQTVYDMKEAQKLVATPFKKGKRK